MPPNGRCAASRQRRTWRCRRSTAEATGRSRGLDLRAGAGPGQRSGRHYPAHCGVEQLRRRAAGPADQVRPMASRGAQGRTAARSRLRTRRCSANGRGSRAGSSRSGRGSRRCARSRSMPRTGTATAGTPRSSTTGTSGSPRRGRSPRSTVTASASARLDLEYLAACQVADRLARNRTRRMQALVGVLAFGVVAGLAGWLNRALPLALST